MMKKFLLLLLALFTLAAGCSLTPDGTQGGTAGLRLLQGTNGSTALSDPDHDDWSPQMVDYGKKYLYFLSTRPFKGKTFYSGIWIDVDKMNSHAAVFRAEMVSPGVFTNLQLMYEFNSNYRPDSIIVISNQSSAAAFPTVWGNDSGPGTIQKFFIEYDISERPALYNWDTPATFIGGGIQTASGTVLFLSSTQSGSRPLKPQILDLPCSGIAYQPFWPNDSAPQAGNTVTKIEPDLAGLDPAALEPFSSTINSLKYLQTEIIEGMQPTVFYNTDKSQSRFGFYISLKGILHMFIHLNCSDYTDYQDKTGPNTFTYIINNESELQNQALYPILSITHYPGSTDKNPCFHEGTGLYFASDRGNRGNFDLYYVPKQYLSVPQEIFPATSATGGDLK